MPCSGGRSGFQADGGKDGGLPGTPRGSAQGQGERSLWSFRHGRYSLREVHPAQQVLETGFVAEKVKFREGFDLKNIRSALLVGPL